MTATTSAFARFSRRHKRRRRAAKARTAVSKIDATKALQKTKTWDAFQEKLAAVRDYTAMAEQYAWQALIEAKMRAT